MQTFNQLDINGIYSYADYLMWKFEERVEIIAGRIFKMAAPDTRHQKVSMRLTLKIGVYLEKSACQLFSAPFDVRLPRESGQNLDNQKIYDVVQPDLCVICNSDIIDARGCNGAPDLVVEILSKSTSRKDLKEKYELYEQSKVKEYWVVHPSEQTVIIYALNEQNKYVTNGKFLTFGDTLHTAIFPDLTINLADIFEED